MPYNIVIDENRGAQVISRKDKSSVTYPSAFGADLDGCGVETHIKTLHGLNLNARVNCQSPKNILQMSLSTIASIEPVGALNPSNAGVAGTWSYIGILQYLMEQIFLFNTETLQSPVPVPPPAIAGRVLQRRGTGYVFDGLKDGLERIEVGVPQIFYQADNCGVPAVVRGKVSYSFTAFDLETCKPILAHQISLGLAVDVFPVPEGAGLNGGRFASVANAMQAISLFPVQSNLGTILPTTASGIAAQTAVDAQFATFTDNLPIEVVVPYDVVTAAAPAPAPAPVG